MIPKFAGHLPARLGVHAKGIHSRIGVKCPGSWIAAPFGLRPTFYENGGMPGNDHPVGVRSDAPPQRGDSILQKLR